MKMRMVVALRKDRQIQVLSRESSWQVQGDLADKALLRQIKMTESSESPLMDCRPTYDVKVIRIQDETFFLAVPDGAPFESLPEAQRQGQSLFSGRIVERQGRLGLKRMVIEINTQTERSAGKSQDQQKRRNLERWRSVDRHNLDERCQRYRHAVISLPDR